MPGTPINRRDSQGFAAGPRLMSHAQKSAHLPPTDVRPRPAPRGGQPRSFGCGWGSGGAWALGLAAVAAVIVWGHILASRTTRIAVESVRSMQTEHEPRAQRASAVVESLVAYDRTVIEYLQSGHSAGSRQHHQRQQFAGRGQCSPISSAPPIRPRPCQLRRRAAQLLPQLTSHMEHGRDLANMPRSGPNGSSNATPPSTGSNSESTRRAARDWRSTATRLSPPARSAELAAAINAVRGNFAPAPVIAQREHEFVAALRSTQRRAATLTRPYLARPREAGLCAGGEAAVGHRQVRCNQRCLAAPVPRGECRADRPECSNICRSRRDAALMVPPHGSHGRRSALSTR